MAAMATTRDPAQESVNLLTLLPAGLALSDVSDPAYPSDLDTTRWLYHEPTGLLTNKLYADGNGTAYSYTPDGKLATRTWARLVVPPSGGAPVPLVTSYGYEPGGSRTNIVYRDSTPAFAYDRLGRQRTVTDASGLRTFSYNDLLQLAAETNAMAVVERRYDALGRDSGFEVGRSSPSEPSPYSVTYDYDAYGRFHSVSSSMFSGAPSKVQPLALAACREARPPVRLTCPPRTLPVLSARRWRRPSAGARPGDHSDPLPHAADAAPTTRRVQMDLISHMYMCEIRSISAQPTPAHGWTIGDSLPLRSKAASRGVPLATARKAPVLECGDNRRAAPLFP
jgi:YD repeat-containing protein